MGFSSLGLGLVFSAKDLATSKISGLNAQMKKLANTSDEVAAKYEKSMGAMKSGAKWLAAGVVGLMGINRVSKAYETFEFGLVSAGQIMGASASEMKKLKAAAIEAGIATQWSPTEAVAGLENLGAAGMNAKQAIATLNPVLNLATASLGQMGVADAASVVVGVLNAFGETTDMASKRVDQLVRITQRSNFQARDFAVALSQASAQAKAADQSFESMVATLGLLRNTNLDASSAATAYREATRRLAGDTQALKVLKKHHIKVIDEETGKIKDLAKIVFEIKPQMDKLNASERNLALTKMFGVRGMKTYNAVLMGYQKLVKEGKLAVGDYAGAHRILVNELNNSEGAAAKTAEALQGTGQGMRTLMKGSWETFQVMAGEMFTPVLKPAIESITKLLNMMIGLIQSIPAPIKELIGNFAGFASVGLIAAGSVRMMTGAVGFLRLRMAAAGGLLEGLAEKTQAYADKTEAGVKGTTRWSRAMRGMSGVLGGLGKALPYIGIAIAAGTAIYKYGMRDQEKLEKKRMELERQRAALAQKQIENLKQIEEVRARVAKNAAAETYEMIQQVKTGKVLLSQQQAKIEKTMVDKLVKQRELRGEIARISREISDKEKVSGTEKEVMALKTEKMKLEKQVAGVNEYIKHQKWGYAVLAGMRAENALKWERDETKRSVLTEQAMTGRLFQERNALEKIRKLKEKIEMAESVKAFGRAAELRKQLAAERSERVQHKKKLESMMGLQGLLTTKGIPKAVKVAAMEAFGGAGMAETRRIGTEPERFQGLFAAGQLPEGGDLATIQRYRKFVSRATMGGTSSDEAVMLMTKIEQRMYELMGQGTGVKLADAVEKLRQLKLHSRTDVRLDGKKVGEALTRIAQENDVDRGKPVGAGES